MRRGLISQQTARIVISSISVTREDGRTIRLMMAGGRTIRFRSSIMKDPENFMTMS